MGTRLTLAETVRRYIDEEDADNSHFTDDELYDYINQAIRYLGTDLGWPTQTATASAVLDQAIYTLPDDFISLLDVYLDNRDLIIIDREDLSAINSSWQDTESSTPQYAYRSDTDRFGLFPKPDSDSEGDTIQIRYVKVPDDLSTDIDVPDLHTAFQDCLPFYAAFLCEHKMGNSKRSEMNLALFERHKKQLLGRLKNFSEESLRFRWSGRYL